MGIDICTDNLAGMEFSGQINPHSASEFKQKLVAWINNFHENLDDEHEVGVSLSSFGKDITFHIKSIGCWNPALISFTGITENGDPIELVQHVSQISILLLKLDRLEPDKPKSRIGFKDWEEDDEQKEVSQ